MKTIEEIIQEICLPIAENKQSIMVRKMPNAGENEDVYLVIGESNDIARLIGHGGTVANAIREVVSVAGKLTNRRIRIKFESFDKLEEEE